MGNNYDFRFNEPLPDSKRIEQHKDFAALLDKYKAEKSPVKQKKRASMRVVWIGLTTAVAAAIAYLLIIKPFGTEVDTDALFAAQEVYFADKAFVQAPIPSAEPGFTQKTMAAEKGGAYDLNAGLKLVVPEMAFMDDRGREITGEIQLEYREMHDPVDFFLTGVPMYFDSLGQHYQMESAGMIEVYCFQDGKPIQLAPDKKIKVELVSKVVFSGESLTDNFSLFYLDTVQRRWVQSDLPLQQEIIYATTEDESGRDQVNQLQLLAEAEAKTIAQAEQANPMPEKPVNRFEKPSSAPSFELRPDDMGEMDAETRAILENEELTGVWWIAKGQSYDLSVLQAKWPKMQLRYRNQNLYEMTLSAGDSSLQLLIQPVLIGPELEAANKKYREDLADYNSTLQSWDQELTARKEVIRDSFALVRQQLLRNQSAGTDTKLRGTIKSTFEVDAFGIWNCDRLLAPGTKKIIDKLEDQNGRLYQNHTAYLLDANKNTIYQFYAGEKALLEVPESEDILIWVVDKNDKMAVLRKPVGRKDLMDDSVETLQLEWQDILVDQPNDLRVLLKHE